MKSSSAPYLNDISLDPNEYFYSKLISVDSCSVFVYYYWNKFSDLYFWVFCKFLELFLYFLFHNEENLISSIEFHFLLISLSYFFLFIVSFLLEIFHEILIVHLNSLSYVSSKSLSLTNISILLVCFGEVILTCSFHNVCIFAMRYGHVTFGIIVPDMDRAVWCRGEDMWACKF